MDQQARGVDPDRHVGELPANTLEVGDGPAELVSRRRVAERALVGALRQPERHRRGAEALAVVRRHELLEAVAGADEQVLLRDLTAIEMQLALGDAAKAHHEFAAADAKAGRVALDENAADAVGAGAAAEASIHEIETRRARTGDPALVAVDAIAGRRLLDARFHICRRRPGRRLADGDGRLLALEHPGKPAALLRVGAI